MNILWNWVNDKEHSYEWKSRLFLTLNCIIFAILGLVLWMIIRNFAFNTLEYAICFVGYPGFCVGYLGGFVFLYRQ